jgi:Sortase domain
MTDKSTWLRASAAITTLIMGLVLTTDGVLGWRHDEHATPVAFGVVTVTNVARAPKHVGAQTPTKPTVHHVLPRAAMPVHLTIPSLKISAPIDPVTVNNGSLVVPTDITRVGWWVDSTPPGAATGTTVVDGHVDSARNGLGALFYISRLRPGAIIELTTVTGSTLRYRVYAGRTYRKANGLPAQLFSETGPGRLVLITCGGPFNYKTHSYADNVVIFASPQP